MKPVIRTGGVTLDPGNEAWQSACPNPDCESRFLLVCVSQPEKAERFKFCAVCGARAIFYKV